MCPFVKSLIKLNKVLNIQTNLRREGQEKEVMTST